MLFSPMDRLRWALLHTTIRLVAVDGWGAVVASSPGELFQAQRSASGQPLCRFDPPMASVQVRNAAECALRCTDSSSFSCANFNAKKNASTSCELYTSGPACLQELPGCVFYQVVHPIHASYFRRVRLSVVCSKLR